MIKMIMNMKMMIILNEKMIIKSSPTSNNETPGMSPPFIYLIKETNCEINEALSKVHVTGSRSPEKRLLAGIDHEEQVATSKEASKNLIDSWKINRIYTQTNMDETQFPYDNGSFSDAVANRKSKPKDNE